MPWPPPPSPRRPDVSGVPFRALVATAPWRAVLGVLGVLLLALVLLPVIGAVLWVVLPFLLAHAGLVHLARLCRAHPRMS